MVGGSEKTVLHLCEPVMDESESKAVQAVLEGGWLAEGKVTEAFERRVAEYVGAKHAVATSNCTIAMELCLKTLNITDTVLIPDFTHSATIQAAINSQVKSILVDVQLDTYNVGMKGLTIAEAFMPVSWAGNPLDFWVHDLPVIEDAACSLGATSECTTHPTEWIKARCFSFHPRKLITTGEGGMVTTNNIDLANRIRQLKNFGEGGGNYKFDDVRAAIGLTQMDKLERIIERRIKMAKIYEDLLKPYPWIKPPQKHPQSRHTFQTYAVYLERGNRDKIIVKLREKGIETQIGAYALHLLPQFKDVERVGSLVNSELLHRNLLALPMAYSLTDEEQKFVIDELSKAIHN